MQPLSRAARIILIGAPGVGKGTQTQRLINFFPQLSAISSGDLLRQNVRNRTPLGIQAEAKIKTGSLVPDNMILRLITNELSSRGWIRNVKPATYTLQATATSSVPSLSVEDGYLTEFSPKAQKYECSDMPSASFLLDGFPRTAAQAAQVDKLVPINLVVHISTPTSIILDRICNRWVHERSGRVYNTTFNAPKIAGKDDVTGDPLTRRSDDDPKTWEVRLKKFQETSQPLLEHYDKQGLLWTVGGNTSDEISPKLFQEVIKRFC